MSRAIRAMTGVGGGALMLLTLAAAIHPAVLIQAGPGLWEIAGGPDGGKPKICVANPMVLAQLQHRSGNCRRDIVRESATSAEISYSCAGGGFGTTTIQQITPRALRIETQGISDNAPFHYVIQARKIGNC